ncbi:hypothetical protein [Xylanibacter rodentium]|uniref:hypothetical protein n=1 Tax=Xylanibacter rodentium TaxID=2736289 RepID=UPI0025977601|nr:hypothetical protein [Xylanibacter rodentium]
MEDQDDYGNSLGTSQWFENTDDAVSMAVCPVITYDPPVIPDAIVPVEVSSDAGDDAIYTLQGIRVTGTTLPAGIYIKGGKKVAF